MKKMYVLALSLVLALSFAACDIIPTNLSTESTQSDSTTTTSTTATTVQLTMDNYEDYFFIQREIVSWNVTEYYKNTYFKYYKVDVVMKLTVLPKANNITFNNVQITFSFDQSNTKYGEPTNPPAGYVHSYWKGSGGILSLAYNGEGFLQLMSYWDENYLPNDLNMASQGKTTFDQPPYVISTITGNITVK